MDSLLSLISDYGIAVYIILFLYCALKSGALPVGMTDISWRQFTVLNAASAIVWAILLVGVGYVFGEAIEVAVVKGWGLASVVLLILSITLIWLGFRHVARTSLD